MLNKSTPKTAIRKEIILPEIKTIILDEKFSIIFGATIMVIIEPMENMTKR